MAFARTMHPGLKEFMTGALPGDNARHVLALGEWHIQRHHYQKIQSSLSELKRDHNLGTLGFEGSPLFDIFLWAYRDQKKDPRKKILAVENKDIGRYLETLNRLYAPDPLYRENIAAKVRLECAAIDQKLDVVHFDSRGILLRDIEHADALSSDMLQLKKVVSNVLYEVTRRRPDLAQALRYDPTATCALADAAYQMFGDQLREMVPSREELKKGLGFAFVESEASRLLQQDPDYQRWYQNIEAVIEAARCHVNEDGVSAALFEAQSDPTKNAITFSGVDHVTGVVGVRRCQGTFDKHLARMKLQVTTALMGSENEMGIYKKEFAPTGSRTWNFARNGHREFAPPPIVISDLGAVIDAKNLPAEDLPTEEFADKVRNAPLNKLIGMLRSTRETYPPTVEHMKRDPEEKILTHAEKLLAGRTLRAAIDTVRDDAQTRSPSI